MISLSESHATGPDEKIGTHRALLGSFGKKLLATPFGKFPKVTSSNSTIMPRGTAFVESSLLGSKSRGNMKPFTYPAAPLTRPASTQRFTVNKTLAPTHNNKVDTSPRKSSESIFAASTPLGFACVARMAKIGFPLSRESLRRRSSLYRSAPSWPVLVVLRVSISKMASSNSLRTVSRPCSVVSNDDKFRLASQA